MARTDLAWSWMVVLALAGMACGNSGGGGGSGGAGGAGGTGGAGGMGGAGGSGGTGGAGGSGGTGGAGGKGGAGGAGGGGGMRVAKRHVGGKLDIGGDPMDRTPSRVGLKNTKTGVVVPADVSGDSFTVELDTNVHYLILIGDDATPGYYAAVEFPAEPTGGRMTDLLGLDEHRSDVIDLGSFTFSKEFTTDDGILVVPDNNPLLLVDWDGDGMNDFLDPDDDNDMTPDDSDSDADNDGEPDSAEDDDPDGDGEPSDI